MSSTSKNANEIKMGIDEIKRVLDLEKSLTWTKNIFLLLCLCIVVIIILYSKYPDVFVPQFGYSIFLTVILIFLMVSIWVYYSMFKKSNPDSTVENIMSQYGKLKFFGAFIIIAAIIIGLCFGIIAMLGSDKNNTGHYITYIVFLLLAIISGVIYKFASSHDDKITPELPKHTQEFYYEKKKYIGILILFFIAIALLYIFNPGGYITKYGGATLFLTIFFGIALIFAIITYHHYFTRPEKNATVETIPGIATFLKAIYVVIGLGVSALFFYWLINAVGLLKETDEKSDKDKMIKTIVNIVLLIGMFAVLYKLLNAGGYFASSPIFRLIFNTIMYIPCLLVVMVDFISDLFNKKPGAATSAVAAATTLHGATTGLNEVQKSSSPIVFGNTTKNDLLFFGGSVSICGLYLLMNYILVPYGMKIYYRQGGKQLINNPIPIDVLTNVATYETLNGDDKKGYNYAISFWFYIDAFSPSTNSSYLKSVPILSYGDNPCIKYHSPSNSIIITVKQKTDGADVVGSIHKLEKNINKENIGDWNKIQDKIKSGIEMIKTLPISSEEDENGNRLIYKRKDILLQKWNNIVLNYSGGTLDVFYNGELVKSSIEVVPKINYDMLTVGTDNGISGNIANLMYFDHSLNYLTINKLYTMLKDESPPSITTIDERLVPLPREY